jgi:S-formylglutathione hydrolase
MYVWAILFSFSVFFFLQAYDATHLVKSYPGSHLDILIDQGKDDEFLLDGQLLPDNFIAACTEKKIPVVLRLQEASTRKL